MNDSSYDQAVALALAMFAECYRNKWQIGESSLDVWRTLLYDLDEREIVRAAKAWCLTQKWPPTPSELRQMVPRLCRCGQCRACRGRALENARAAVREGRGGCDDFGPVPIADAARGAVDAIERYQALPPPKPKPQIGDR